jgi:hypothetical protein
MAARTAPQRPRTPRETGALLVRLVVTLAAPVLTYMLLRPHLHSDLAALVIGAAIPIAYTCVVLLWRRHLDPIGAFAVVCFVLGLLLVLATGGNEFIFKIREDIWTGVVGLACLVSLIVRRPLFLMALRLAARRNPQIAERITRPGINRISTVTTAALAAILLVHAAVIIALAVTTSTATYLALSRPIGLAILGGGLAALAWWITRYRSARRRGSPAD